MNQEPLVSIIVVTYNSAKYVLETLESAKSQTYQNIELIVTDDHSTDQTLAICQKWMDENKERFVRSQLVTSEKNTGISSNCNRGFKTAKGEWVKYIAGDDILNPECIDTFLLYAKSNPEASFIFSDMEIFGDDGNSEKREFVRSWLNSSLRIFEKMTTSTYQHKQILIRNNVSAPSMIFKAKSFQDVGGFDEEIKLMEDRPLWLNATKNGYKILSIREKLIRYRVNGNSVQTSNRYTLASELFLQKYIFKNVFFKLIIKHIDQLNPQPRDIYLYSFLKMTAFPQRIIWKFKMPDTKLKKLLQLMYTSLFFLFSNPKAILLNLKYYKSNIHRKSIIRYTDRKSIIFGEQLTIGAYSVLIVANDSSPDSFKDTTLTIGGRTYIGENNNISAIGGKINIGKDCTISHHVTIAASNHNITKSMIMNKHGWSGKGNDIIIEDEVYVGTNCVILPGVVVGKGAVIRDGSIVTESIPEYAFVEGNPAKIIKQIERSQL